MAAYGNNHTTNNQWECATCTFINVSASNQCTLCRNLDVKCAQCGRKISKKDYDSHLLAHQLQNNNTSPPSNNKIEAKAWQAKSFDDPSFKFKGTWQEAKTYAVIQNKYILLNIQDMQNFVSHCLNRDLWQEKNIETAIKKSFIFYQCFKTSENARKLIDFYKLLTIPCIIVINPNNAQQKHTFTVPTDPRNVLNIKFEILNFSETNHIIKCLYCNIGIPSTEYNSHLAVHEIQSNLIPCESCGQQIQFSKFSDHTSICKNKNNRNVGSDVTYLTCTEQGCDARFILKTEYNDHMLVHQLSQPEPMIERNHKPLIYVICPKCKGKILEKEYSSHELVHKLAEPEPKKSSDPLVLCEYPSCNKQIRFSEFQQHRLWHENKEKEAPIQCEYKGCTQIVAFNEIQRHQLDHQRQDAENKLSVMRLQLNEMEDQLKQEVEEKKQALESVKEKEELNSKIQQQQKHIDELKENAVKEVAKYKQELAKKSDASGVKYPTWWNVNIDDIKHGEVKILELDLNTSSEAKTVVQLFNKTAQNKVIKIEYVINRILFDEWYNGKEILSKAIGENKLNERMLFHGTRSEPIMYNEVIKDGFKKVFNKGYSVGMGTYFARDASYSVNYASNLNGVRKMFCCMVITGESAQGNNGILLTSWPKKPNGLIYDSLVNNVANPSIFVIHKNSRIYPMFIISFK